MKKIDSFLNRYKGVTLRDIELKEFFCRLVLEKIGIELKNKAVKKQNNNLSVKAGSLYRNEILLHKKELLQALKPFKIENII